MSRSRTAGDGYADARLAGREDSRAQQMDGDAQSSSGPGTRATQRCLLQQPVPHSPAGCTPLRVGPRVKKKQEVGGRCLPLPADCGPMVRASPHFAIFLCLLRCLIFVFLTASLSTETQRRLQFVQAISTGNSVTSRAAGQLGLLFHGAQTWCLHH